MEVAGREKAGCKTEADHTWEAIDKAEADSMPAADYLVAGTAGYMIVQIEEAAEQEASVVMAVLLRLKAYHNCCRTAHFDEPALNN